MSKVRINDLAREMEVKSRQILDILAELGLGAGWLERDYSAAGICFDPPGVRIERLEETIRIIKGLFAPSPFSFAGRHYRVDSLEGLLAKQPGMWRPYLLLAEIYEQDQQDGAEPDAGSTAVAPAAMAIVPSTAA